MDAGRLVDDRLFAALGIVPEGALAEAIAMRAGIFEMTARNREAVLRPSAPGGLSLGRRAALACRVMRLCGEDALLAAYSRDLQAAGADAATAALADPLAPPPKDPRLLAILAHLDKVSLRPADATRDDVAALEAAGLDSADIVALSQLVAYLAYEARLFAGLRLMVMR